MAGNPQGSGIVKHLFHSLPPVLSEDRAAAGGFGLCSWAMLSQDGLPARPRAGSGDRLCSLFYSLALMGAVTRSTLTNQEGLSSEV
ncbi:hypothetical protein LEMLEM_LOCUS7080 [Lemmus lemmus]